MAHIGYPKEVGYLKREGFLCPFLAGHGRRSEEELERGRKSSFLPAEPPLSSPKRRVQDSVEEAKQGLN
jgi:hypothetical protein